MEALTVTYVTHELIHKYCMLHALWKNKLNQNNL